MPQFAIHRTPARNPTVAFVVQVQSTRLDHFATRIVVPLVRIGPGSPRDEAMTPHLAIEGTNVWADVLNLAAVRARQLGPPVGALSEPDSHRLTGALDEAISRF